MNIWVIETENESKMYELAYGRNDTYYHFVCIDDDEIDPHQFESQSDAIKGLEEFKKYGVIKNYYQFQ